MIRLVNRLLKTAGLMVIHRPASANMVHEHANVSETHHPTRNAKWLRSIADVM